MNIGRTIRVFRAEPVVSPVPEAPGEVPVVEHDRPPAVAVEHRRGAAAAPDAVPARVGG